MNLRVTLPALILGWAMVVPAKGRAADRSPQASPEEIQKLVGQLGGTQAEVVHKAKQRLVEIGMPALAAVSSAAFQEGNKAQRRDAEEVAQQIAKNAQAALEKRLGKRTKDAIIYRLTNDALANIFPAYLVYAVRYPLYPTRVRPPAPLKAQNLFIVDRDGQMDYVTDFKGLEEFFRNHVGKGLKEARVQKAAIAWLALSQELEQDGYFQFSIAGDSVKVGRVKAGLQVVGRAVVQPAQGDKGSIEVTLTFDMTGDLQELAEEKKLHAGTRPK
jgi:hypothetical protein